MSTSKSAQVLGALAMAGLACGTLMLADGPGVRPRLNATAYPASGAVDQGSVAAAALSHSEVRGNFSADLNKGYLVFEVSFYPAAGTPMKIFPHGFHAQSRPEERRHSSLGTKRGRALGSR